MDLAVIATARTVSSPVKILISTDIEGVAGVFHSQQTRAGNPEYERARLLMTHEANAAIAGAFDAGAAEVLVNDSHGDFRNMPPELLDPRARAVMGKPRYLSMMAGVDEGVDAVCLVGYHSRAQGRGILAHTINSFAFARVLFNDVELGEAGIYGALAGQYGVPVAMASGDDAFIEEHRPLFPHAVFVQTKRATGQTSGISLSPAQACAAIRSGVATALAGFGAARPLVLEGPIVVRVQTQTPALADLFCQWPSLRRIAGDELAFDASNVEAAVRVINSLSAMSTVLR
jgi:D-amino peptidase